MWNVILAFLMLVIQLVCVFYAIKYAQRYGYAKAMYLMALLRNTSKDIEMDVMKKFQPNGIFESPSVNKLFAEVIKYTEDRNKSS